MKIYSFNDLEPVEILRSGGIVAFPTETVFGLGVKLGDESAFSRLIKVKRRPADKPFTVMLGDPSQIYDYAYVDKAQERVIKKLLPGELTVILKKRDSIPDYATLGGDTVGFRVPALKELREFLLRVNIPLLVPSANRSGEPPAKSVNEITEVFGDEIDGAIDGNGGDSIPSTVVSLIGEKPVVLRRGKVTEQEIDDCFYGR